MKDQDMQLIVEAAVAAANALDRHQGVFDSGQNGQIDFLHVTIRVGRTGGNTSRALQIPTGGKMNQPGWYFPRGTLTG